MAEAPQTVVTGTSATEIAMSPEVAVAETRAIIMGERTITREACTIMGEARVKDNEAYIGAREAELDCILEAMASGDNTLAHGYMVRKARSAASSLDMLTERQRNSPLKSAFEHEAARLARIAKGLEEK